MSLFLKLCLFAALLYSGLRWLPKPISWPKIKPAVWLWTLVGLYVFVFFYLGVARHVGLNTYALDLTVYQQAFVNWQLFSPIIGKSLMADHFSPVLYLLLPVMKLFNSPLTLLLLQAAALALAGVPLYSLARRLGLEAVPALVLVFVYYNFVYTGRLANSDFRVEHLLPLAFLLVFDAYAAGVSWKFWVWLGLALGIKEDAGFYLLPWLLMAGAFYRERRLQAWIAAGVCLAVGLLALVAMLLANHGVYPYFSHWSHWGKGLFGILAGALSQPFATLGVWFTPEFLKMLLATAFLPLATFWGLALLPPVWVQLASSRLSQATLQWYYAAPIIPFLFAALAAGWAAMDRRLQNSPSRQAVALGIALYLLIFNFNWVTPAKANAESQAARKLLHSLPAKGRVLAQSNLGPQISHPERITVLGMNAFDKLPHFIVFHVQGNIWPFNREKYLQVLDQIRLDPRYALWKEGAGILIFRLKPVEKK
ncbi:MAG: DUF2079 domain-containing protein [candidate division FCPU426 bacterium]